ncbi:MAG: C4-dicarboxylate ABC transporter, partial [Rhizobium rhizophilum]
MKLTMTRRFLMASAITFTALAASSPLSSVVAQDKPVIRMSTPASETDQRSVALSTAFGPAISEFATYQPHYNASLVPQGSELEAIAAGDLEMSITSAQELANFLPEFSIFATGYVHRSAQHQVNVFN